MPNRDIQTIESIADLTPSERIWHPNDVTKAMAREVIRLGKEVEQLKERLDAAQRTY